MSRGALMSVVLKGLVPFVILVCALALGAWFMGNPQESQKRPRPDPLPLLVETGRAEHGSFVIKIEGMGQIVPANSAVLRSRVSGEIIEISPEFLPGGVFAQGNMLLGIDPRDYLLSVQRQEAILRQAQASYDLEMGRQTIARQEHAFLPRTSGQNPSEPTDLALRKPQYVQAEAERDKAQADLDSARLDLARTHITAPFDALMIDRAVSVGDVISAGQMLATLVQTDSYWVDVSVPLHDLRWLEGRESAARAVVFPDGGRSSREGVLLRITGQLEESSRLARLIVSVPDPLSRKAKIEDAANVHQDPLVLGDFVRVEITGQTLENALRVPVTWIRDDGILWVLESDRLVFREITPVYVDKTHAFFEGGLSVDDVIVISRIALPVENMSLRTADARPEKGQGL